MRGLQASTCQQVRGGQGGKKLKYYFKNEIQNSTTVHRYCHWSSPYPPSSSFSNSVAQKMSLGNHYTLHTRYNAVPRINLSFFCTQPTPVVKCEAWFVWLYNLLSTMNVNTVISFQQWMVAAKKISQSLKLSCSHLVIKNRHRWPGNLLRYLHYAHPT